MSVYIRILAARTLPGTLLAALLCLCVLTTGLSNPTPFELNRQLILSEAIVNGQKVTLILDSGAPGLVLNSKYYTSASNDAIKCYGINGTFDCATYQLSSWQWLGIDFNRTDAILSDLSFLEKSLKRRIDGLAGLSLLDDHYVTLDFTKHTISLDRKTEEKKGFISFSYADHLPVVTCKINGTSTRLGLDTGAAANFLFSNHSGEITADTNDAIPVVVTGTDNTSDVKHIIPFSFSLRDEDEDVDLDFIVDLDNAGFIRDTRFEGLLGQNFLARYIITIHPGKQKIKFEPRDESLFVRN